jgi:hypothetical protein
VDGFERLVLLRGVFEPVENVSEMRRDKQEIGEEQVQALKRGMTHIGMFPA